MKLKLLVAFTSIFLILFNSVSAQNSKSIKSLHQEVQDGVYVPVSRDAMPKSPALTYRSSTIFTTQVNIDAGGNNIVGDAGNEPSIAIDPTDPNRIVIGWRQFDDVNNNFRQAGYAYTTDAGNSWTFPGPIDPGVFRSDPVLDSDANGNFYYNSLGIDGGMHCEVYKIEDGGVEWDEGRYAIGGDKQWMRIDKSDGIGAGNNYSFWSSSYSACSGNFTRSTDYGETYESCLSVEGDLYWGTLAIGSEGELYIAGSGTYPISLVKSSNAQDPSESVTWDFITNVNLDGHLSGWSPVNPAGLVGQVWVATDISTGAGEGNVYVLAAVERDSNSDPADIMFARSTDGGVSFETPIRINTDISTTNYQWFGTMSVAPNGRIDVIWLDTRDAPGATPHHSALYYSYSIDQGATWSDNQQVSDYFDPHVGYPQQDKMGDYFDMKSDDNGAHLAWANTLNGGQDVYYSHLTPEYLGVDALNEVQSISIYPNPFIKETKLSFALKDAMNVKIEVFDVLGKRIKILKDNFLDKGNHQILWDGTNQNGEKQTESIYFIKFSTNTTYLVKKVIFN